MLGAIFGEILPLGETDEVRWDAEVGRSSAGKTGSASRKICETVRFERSPLLPVTIADPLPMESASSRRSADETFIFLT